MEDKEEAEAAAASGEHEKVGRQCDPVRTVKNLILG